MPFGILGPTFALVGLIFILWFGFAVDMLHSADVHDAALRNMLG